MSTKTQGQPLQTFACLKPGTQWYTSKHTMVYETSNFIGVQSLLHTLHVFMTAISPAKKSLVTNEETEVRYYLKSLAE